MHSVLLSSSISDAFSPILINLKGIPLALTISKKIIKDGACRVHGGGFAGTILAIVNKEESSEYVKVMKKVFGDVNCNKVELRKLGVTKL